MAHLPSSPSSPAVAEPVPIRLPRGTVLGRHVVDGWLREGGMASLYRGHHVETGARVAIKVQGRAAEDAATVAARFAREGEVMGRLCGVPNVVQVHDMGALPDGRRYLVMEWIEGDNLEELLDGLRDAGTSPSIDRACRLVADVARALERAHAVGVVHRDVKPSNIMVDRGLGDREVAKLLDFGISADLGAGERGGDLTATGVVLGTSRYVAPEQALGLPAHPAFDVYALGAVLFEAITGYSMPPEGLGPTRLPAMGQLRAGVPGPLEVLVERCMSRDPLQRPGSAAEVLAVLEGVLADRAASGSMAASVPGERTPADASVAAGAVVRRGPSRWWWVAVAGAMALAGGLGWWWRDDSEIVAVAAVEDSALGSTSASVPAQVTDTGIAEEGLGASATLGTSTTGSPEPGDASEGTTAVELTTSEADVATSGDAMRSVPRGGCRRARSEAEAARARRDWRGVIRASEARECWSSSAQRRERKAMRVKAWIELRRYDRCVSEGAGSTEPEVARLTKHCRDKLAAGG